MAPERLARASTHWDGPTRSHKTLLGRCAAGDPQAREALIIELLPYARYLARRFSGRGEPLEDLYQAASVGLIKAVDRYDAERCASFVGYAQFVIIGEIRNHFRAAAQRVHLPRALQERTRAVARAREELRAGSGSEPTAEMIATHLGIGVEKVTEADEALRTRRPQSLDAPVGADGGEDFAVGERLGDHDPEYDRVEAVLWCQDALRRLPPRERDVVVLRFGGELTQADIARRVGVSQMQVSRLLRAALATMTAVAGFG